MSGDMLAVGITGLLAYQRALRTVSHNVSNANTEGYSRQRVEFTTRPPLFLGGGYLGTGVQIAGIERVYDDFTVGQVRSYTSAFNQAETYSRYAGQVDELLADPRVGLMPTIESFFGAIQDVSNDPSALPPRQSLMTQAGTLVDRFHYLNQRFEELRDQLNGQMESVVAEINSLAEGVAELNHQIILAPGDKPNDLLDQRDQLVEELTKRINLSTVKQDDGALNVLIGNGQVLVVGSESRQLSVTSNAYDISQYEIGIDSGASTKIDISSQISGGKLGGVLQFREQVLDPAQNSLGALAIGFATQINAQHRLGQDLNGNLGGDFFDVSSLQVLPGSGVPSTVTANLSDATMLTGDEYLLTYSGGNAYSLVRQSDNQVTNINTGGVSPYTTVAIDGFSLTITAGAAVGDSYLIRPTRTGASNIDLALNSPREIAAATPIRAELAASNTGNATITPGVVTNTANLPLPGNVTLTYDSGLNQFTVGGAVPPVAPIGYVNGGTIAFNGIEFSISGVPQNGDQFVIRNNTNGVGDNRNALLLAGLQTQRLLGAGTATFQEHYGQMVADVGIKTNQANINEKSQTNLLDQARNARDGISGVNMDEEAADLIKYQMAYQAAAQVVASANTIFQTLLSAVGR